MAAKKRASGSNSGASGLTHAPFGSLGSARLKGVQLAPGTSAHDRGQPTPAATEPLAIERKLVIRRELKGRGGKTVTRITGLPSAQRDGLASQMKRKLGCGAIVEGEDVLLLGDLMDRAADWLQAQGANRIVKGN